MILITVRCSICVHYRMASTRTHLQSAFIIILVVMQSVYQIFLNKFYSFSFPFFLGGGGYSAFNKNLMRSFRDVACMDQCLTRPSIVPQHSNSMPQAQYKTSHPVTVYTDTGAICRAIHRKRHAGSQDYLT